MFILCHQYIKTILFTIHIFLRRLKQEEIEEEKKQYIYFFSFFFLLYSSVGYRFIHYRLSNNSFMGGAVWLCYLCCCLRIVGPSYQNLIKSDEETKTEIILIGTYEFIL